MNRPNKLLSTAVFGVTILVLTPLALTSAAPEPPQPIQSLPRESYNVLFIAIDDLNDWVGCLGGKPFFLALGISKPHLPWIVPQHFFDLYPLDKIKYANNTIIMIWGDHGWHLPVHDEPDSPRNPAAHAPTKAKGRTRLPKKMMVSPMILDSHSYGMGRSSTVLLKHQIGSVRACLVACTQAEPVLRSNILIGVADDRGLRAGAHGTRWVKPPAVDCLARGGLLFQNACNPVAKCAPSRASLDAISLAKRRRTTPFFPALRPARRLFQEPSAKCKFLTANPHP